MRRSRILVLLLAALVPFPAGARKTKPTPCTGSFVVSGTPLAGDGSVSPDILVIGSTISTASGCPPVPVTLKATKKGTVGKAARWTSCSGLTGKATLSGKIAAGCASFTGKFKAKKSKVRRTVSAGRSTCGDGALDATTEGCDGTTGCVAGTTCRADCTCGGSGTCVTTPPASHFTHGGTRQAGAAVTFDGSTSTGDDLTWSWSFGDDRRGGGAQIAHVYATAGQRTVRLTVKDACGNTTTSEQILDVAAGPQPTATTTAAGKIRDAGGAPLSGALVTAVPGGSSTSDANGEVTVDVGQGVPVRITVAKAGYAEQVILTQVPDLPDPDAYFEATLIAREAVDPLADAAAGGTVGGRHGAKAELPAGALVDANGATVSGAVDAFVTPIDVTRDIAAFPGRAIGLAPDGSEGPIVTYGVVEYAFEQNGQPLNLAPGAQAFIEIPIYSAKNLDGSALAPGDSYPLWALDPATAGWVQEGTGIVVQSASSPSGLALRGPVTHFSLWNCDQGVPPWNPKPKCLVDTNADGILENLTGTGHCWHGGTGPELPDDGFSANAVEARYPNWIGQVVLPAAGGVIMQVPADMDVVLHSRALGGLLRGTTAIRGPAFVEEDVIVKLTPVDQDSDHITIPFETERSLTEDDSLHVYDFDGTAGQTVFVTVDEPGTSLTSADVSIILPGDVELGPVNYRPTANAAGRIGLALPETGNYRITVDKVAAANPGGYHILVDYTADFPIVVSNTPPANASGVSASVTPSVTFSMDISPLLTADLIQGEDFVAETVDVAGDVATLTPSAPLVAGAAYRVSFNGFRSPGSPTANGFPRPHAWSFNVAEVAGTQVKIGNNHSASSRIAADAAGNVYAAWQGFAPGNTNHETRAAQYAPGVGWSLPTRFNDGAFVGPPYGTAVAVVPGGAVTVFPRPAGVDVDIYESRYTPAAGWSTPQAIESVAGLFRQIPLLGADAAGDLIALVGTDTPSYDVSWSRYTAGGSWTTPAVLFDDAQTADIAVNAGGAAIALAQAIGTNETLVRRFAPGVGWSAVDTFESSPDGFDLGIDDDGNAFLLVVTAGQHRVRRFDVGTQAWSAPLDLQGSPACPSAAHITVDPDGHAFLSGCTNAAPGPGLFAMRYTPGVGGGTWDSAVAIGGAASLHDFGLDASGNAVAMWLESGDATKGHYRRWSTATGWEATIHDFTGIDGNVDLKMAVGGNGVAVVVTDAPFNPQRTFGIRLP
jgi:PKD repeat protein